MIRRKNPLKMVEPSVHPEPRRVSREDIPFILLLAVVCVLFWHKVLLGGRVLYGPDFILQFYPWKEFIRNHLWRHGTLPFWNPYVFSGTPMIANIQASMFYPAGILYYLLPPETAYGYSTIFHVFLGSLFMYVLMRGLSASRVGGFAASVIFGYNGFFMGHVYAGHLSFIQAYIWIPMVFHFWVRFVERGRLRSAATAGFFLGVQALGGFPQLSFYTILGCFLLGAFYFLKSMRAGRTGTLRIGAGLCVLLCVGFGISAIQLLPTLRFSGLSTRAGGISYAFATYDSLNPREILSFLIPDIFGNPVDATYWRSAGAWHFWETCGYVGILPLFLLFVKTGPRLSHTRLFFALLVLFSLFLAPGKYNPVYPFIYRLPGFDRFRIPAQILFLYVFAISVLSGIGIDALSGENRRPGWPFWTFVLFSGILSVSFFVGITFFPRDFFHRLFKTFLTGSLPPLDMARLYHGLCAGITHALLLWLASFVILLAGCFGKISSGRFRVLAVLLILADLGAFSGRLIRTGGVEVPPRILRIVSTLRGTPDRGRVVTTGGLLEANDGLRYRFPSVSGYDPLILRRYVYYTQSSQGLKHDDHVVNLGYIRNVDTPLIKMLNVRKIVFGDRVRAVKNETPYARVVGHAVIKTDEQVLSFMKSPSFDPEKTVVLPPGHRPKPVPEKRAAPFKGSCTVTAYANEEIRVRTSASHAGYLVLSEVYYPGWHARVDNKPVPVLRGNYLFRVIPLEKGDHEVRISFVSWPFRVGAAISLLTFIFSMWGLFRAGRKTGGGRPRVIRC